MLTIRMSLFMPLMPSSTYVDTMVITGILIVIVMYPSLSQYAYRLPSLLLILLILLVLILLIDYPDFESVWYY